MYYPRRAVRDRLLDVSRAANRHRAEHGIFMHAIRQSCAANGHNGEVMLAEASAHARKGGKPIEPIAC
jgi:hypothetical protein